MKNEVSTMTTLHILCGPPASGKSTWAHWQNLPVVSTDAIRRELTGRVEDQSMNQKVFEVAYQRVMTLLLQKEDVIYDATNISYKARRGIIASARKCGQISIVAHIFICPPDVLYERNAERSVHVPQDVINRMIGGFKPPCEWEGIDSCYCHYADECYAYSLGQKVIEMEQFGSQKSKWHTLSLIDHSRAVQRLMGGNEVGLLHDIGKLETARWDEEKQTTHYIGHEGWGAYMALCGGRSLREAALIAWHMAPYDSKYFDKMQGIMSKDFIRDLKWLNKADKEAH